MKFIVWDRKEEVFATDFIDFAIASDGRLVGLLNGEYFEVDQDNFIIVFLEE